MCQLKIPICNGDHCSLSSAGAQSRNRPCAGSGHLPRHLSTNADASSCDDGCKPTHVLAPHDHVASFGLTMSHAVSALVSTELIYAAASADGLLDMKLPLVGRLGALQAGAEDAQSCTLPSTYAHARMADQLSPAA